MNGLTLTQDQISELRRAHRACKDKREADRIKAIYSLGTGSSIEGVVKILMADEETLRNYVKRYQQGGIDAVIKDNYKGSYAKLTAIELQELDAHLQQNTYLTVETIIAYVEYTYAVLYSVSGMTSLLYRLKFTYKNKYYKKFDDFKDATLGFFENLEQYKTELKSLLTNNFQLLDANGS